MMENHVLKDLISVTTKSNDKNAIFKALVRLRAELVKDKNGILTFYNAGGIAPVVRLLSKPYEKILEVALSILGNCCTQQVCCKQTISNGIVPPLITILKSIPNPKVQCRVCRLLGNLARQSNEKICTLAKGIGVVVASILSDTTDVATLSMAIRATRLLWSEMSFYKDFLRADGVDKILKILVDYTMVDPKKPTASSIVDDNPEERNRVDFMEAHIPVMETVNSHVFDCEILKRVKPVVDDSFRIQMEENQYGLIAEILKCLEVVTNLPSVPIIYNLHHHPQCISCITFFVRIENNYRAYALKILSNLAKLGDRKILNDADTMTTVCDLITAPHLAKPLTDIEERYCINVICRLADDACNRAKVRKSGAFKHLLSVAKNTTNDSLLTMILMGLQHFRYDNMSMDLLIKMGLMNVLIDRLQRSINDMKEEHDINKSKSRESNRRDCGDDDDDDCDNDDENDGNVNTDDSESDSKRLKVEITLPQSMPRDPDSPSPSSSYALFHSPCSSPPSPCSCSELSPNTQTYDDMDDYSPVVSDIEDQNDDENETRAKSKRTPKEDIADIDIMQKILNEQSTSKCELEEGNNSDQGEDTEFLEADSNPKNAISQANSAEQKETIHMVLNILCSASYRVKFGETLIELCKPEILNTLLKACHIIYKRRAATSWDSHGAPMVLSYIIDNRNFALLLKYDFIFQVYGMANPATGHQYCKLCRDLKYVGEGLLKKLTVIGESGHGRGEMEHYLSKMDNIMNQRVSIITAMIIRDRKILHTLLIKRGALYTIIDLIIVNRELLSTQAAIGLHALGKTLNIPEPDYETRLISGDTVDIAGEQSDYKWTIEEKMVTLVAGVKVDDKNTVQFSERILTGTSEVFDRMLNSDFRESKDKEVTLKNQSIGGIRYFLDCIRQRSLKKPLRTPIADSKPLNGAQASVMKATLEAYDMCQMYLLPELEKDILNMITYIVDADNFLELFNFSMSTHKHELTELSVDCFLTSINFTADERVKVFRLVDVSDYCKEWNDFILDKIAYTCQDHLS